MIGTGLQKLAKQHGMTVGSGVAYGSLKGFATTLSEGAGYKRIDITTYFPEIEQRDQLREAVNAVDLTRTYRIQNMELGHRHITIIFNDNPGTMKKLEAFIAWFYPLLEQNGASKANLCIQCQEIIDDAVVLGQNTGPDCRMGEEFLYLLRREMPHAVDLLPLQKALCQIVSNRPVCQSRE